MAWFKQKKGRYWYLVRREGGRERYYYLGTEEDIIARLRPISKCSDPVESEKPAGALTSRKKSGISGSPGACSCSEHGVKNAV